MCCLVKLCYRVHVHVCVYGPTHQGSQWFFLTSLRRPGVYMATFLRKRLSPRLEPIQVVCAVKSRSWSTKLPTFAPPCLFPLSHPLCPMKRVTLGVSSSNRDLGLHLLACQSLRSSQCGHGRCLKDQSLAQDLPVDFSQGHGKHKGLLVWQIGINIHLLLLFFFLLLLFF